MGVLHSSFGAVWTARTLEGRLFPVGFVRNRKGTKLGNAHELRPSTHEMRQRSRPKSWIGLGVAPREAQSRLHFGDLGAADRHPGRRRAAECDDGAVPLLADEGDVRDRAD